jgi:hypothetical protein
VHNVLSKQKNFSTDLKQNKSSDGFFFLLASKIPKNLQFIDSFISRARQTLARRA